jgi:hypothetical protein
MRRAGSTAAEETPGGANTRHPWQLCTPALMHICNSCTHMPCLHSPRRMSHATSHAADAGTPQTACMHAATAAAVQNSTFPPAHAQHHGSIADLWVATARPPLHCKAPGSSPPPPLPCGLEAAKCSSWLVSREEAAHTRGNCLCCRAAASKHHSPVLCCRRLCHRHTPALLPAGCCSRHPARYMSTPCIEGPWPGRQAVCTRHHT